jgi:hypothetical protein
MARPGRSSGKAPDEGEKMPESLWQFLGYALREIVDKVLGDWSRTLQLWLLGVLPILVVLGGAAWVAGAIHLDAKSWGIIGGSILSAAAGTTASQGAVWYVRRRRRRRLTDDASTPPSGGVAPTTEDK